MTNSKVRNLDDSVAIALRARAKPKGTLLEEVVRRTPAGGQPGKPELVRAERDAGG